MEHGEAVILPGIVFDSHVEHDIRSVIIHEDLPDDIDVILEINIDR